MSFKKQFVLILMGVVCLNFLFVFISFNVLIQSYIQKEARTELKQSVQRWESMDAVQFEITVAESPEATLAAPIIEAAFVAQKAQPTTALIDTNYIILNSDNQVVFPQAEYTTQEAENQIKTITRYMHVNENEISQQGYISITNKDNSLYITNVPIEDNYNVVLYMDTSPIQSFTTQVNTSLFILLGISGIIVILLGVHMCGGLNQTIRSLCQYADNIGKGKFSSAVDIQWNYLEFNQLATSMETMSNKLAQSDAKQKKFFQNVSHELRTPLMSIQGYAEGILEDIFENPKEAAEIVLSESNKMAHMVNEILYISKIDKETTIDKKNINLNKILYNCIKDMDMISKKQGIEIINQIPTEPVYIMAAPEKITTGITNILENCIRHGKHLVQVSMRKDDTTVEIVIKDDGEGIGSQDIEHIFERFYYGENGNAGIGLSITKEIIELHGGTITAKNNQGAMFIITLPYR